MVNPHLLPIVGPSALTDVIGGNPSKLKHPVPASSAYQPVVSSQKSSVDISTLQAPSAAAAFPSCKAQTAIIDMEISVKRILMNKLVVVLTKCV